MTDYTTHINFTVRYYASAETKKQLQVLCLGDEDEDVMLYTWLITDHNKTTQHDNMK